jgi:hypothetical protein
VILLADGLPADSNDNIREYLLELDDLGKPRVVDLSVIKSGVMNSAVVLLVKLIVMRKGTIPDIPDMGIDIKGRYRFAFDSELIMLQDDIEQQVATYIPELLPVDVKCTMSQTEHGCVNIRIAVNKNIFEIVYDKDSSKIKYLNDEE